LTGIQIHNIGEQTQTFDGESAQKLDLLFQTLRRTFADQAVEAIYSIAWEVVM